MKITDRRIGIRQLSLDKNEVITQKDFVAAMLTHSIYSKVWLEEFFSETFDALEEINFEKRQLAASNAS